MKTRKIVQEEMIFLPGAITVPLDGETCVLDVALGNEIELSHSCGGMGSCGTCRVVVESDLSVLEDRNEIELEIATDRGFQPEERLACQLIPRKGLIVRIP